MDVVTDLFDDSRDAARRRTVHPLLYERFNLRRRAYVLVQQANHVRKFARHYPRLSDTGF